MKTSDQLSPEERKMVFEDIRTGKMDAKRLTSGVVFVTDQSTALNELIEVRKRQMSGKDIDVVFVGPSRRYTEMTGIVDRMIVGEQNEDQSSRFELDEWSTIWEYHSDGGMTVHLSVPDREDHD
jgi:hypothetical protein